MGAEDEVKETQEQVAARTAKEAEKAKLPPITQERFDEVYGSLKRAERKLQDAEPIIKTQHVINQKLAAKVEELLKNTVSSVSAGQLTELRTARVEALRSENHDLVNAIDEQMLDIKLKSKGVEQKGILAEIEEEQKKVAADPKAAWENAEQEFFEDNPDFDANPRKRRLSQVIYGEVIAEDEWKSQSPKKILAEMKRRTEETLSGVSSSSSVSGVRSSGKTDDNSVLPDGVSEDAVARMAQNLGLNAAEFRKQVILSGGLK